MWCAVGGAALSQSSVAQEGTAPVVATAIASPTVPVHLEISTQAGYAAYEERVSIDPTVSEWQAPFFGISGVLEAQTRPWIARLKVNYFSSIEDTEEWTSRGFLAQRNDLSLTGSEVLAEAGYPIETNEGDTTLTPFLGLGYRYQEFTRSRFQTAAVGFSDLGRVNEQYDLLYAQLALVVDHAFSPTAGISVRGQAGWIFFNEAQNSFVAGTVSGDGGFIVGFSTDWYWEIKPDQKVTLGVFLEKQANQGNVNSFTANDPAVGRTDFIVEWPDNDLDRIGLEAAWRWVF